MVLTLAAIWDLSTIVFIINNLEKQFVVFHWQVNRVERAAIWHAGDCKYTPIPLLFIVQWTSGFVNFFLLFLNGIRTILVLF
jgi:hypothetical protein